MKTTVMFSGILKLVPAMPVGEELELPEEAIRLKRGDQHVTLIHQSILKPYKHILEARPCVEGPEIEFETEVWERESDGKKSWALKVKNQDRLRDYIKYVLTNIGVEDTNPEPDRVFHISLANLTGNKFDSVR